MKKIHLLLAAAAAFSLTACSIDYRDNNSGTVAVTDSTAVMTLDVRVSGNFVPSGSQASQSEMEVSSYDLFVFNSTSGGCFLEYMEKGVTASSPAGISGSSDVTVGSEDVTLPSGGLKYVVAVGNPSSGVSYPELTVGTTTFDAFKKGLKVSLESTSNPSAPFAMVGESTVADAGGTKAFVTLHRPFTKMQFGIPESLVSAQVRLCNVPAESWPLVDDFGDEKPSFVDYDAADASGQFYVLYTPGTKDQDEDYRVRIELSGTMGGEPLTKEYYSANPMYEDYLYLFSFSGDMSVSVSPDFSGDTFYVEGVRLSGSTLTFPFTADGNYGYMMNIVTNISGDVSVAVADDWCEASVDGKVLSVRCIQDNLTGTERSTTAKVTLGTNVIGLTIIQQAQPSGDVQFCGMDWMDRNLGATAASDADHVLSSDAYGYYYQWGRNVPFPTFGDIELTDPSSSYTSSVAESMKEFITGSPDASYDWWIAGTEVNDKTTTWRDRTGGTDPCPEGYHVPSYREYQRILPYTNGSGIGRLYDDVRSAVKSGEILDDTGNGYDALYVCSNQEDGTIWAIKKYKTDGAYMIRWQRINSSSGTYLKITYIPADASADFSGDAATDKMASAISAFSAAESSGTGVETLYFPAAGHRDRLTGESSDQGTTMYLWASTCWGASSSSPYMDPVSSTTQRIYNRANSRSHALPVRCIKD
ncbi:MAG: hypothetical protein LKK19_02505 [Bacteroidales bacterium]|jgi:uncharacterized protein (TIGR02145 family)|nr:hypothetical protein [Bacteroidales bacterium]MCI2121556.1 hypothetical protein [Bacteroidales bacterium]MCI2145069.1 hypothetical protein [Bacteroidales bacterium]